MTVIEDLARDVGASVPTIRRAVEIGMIKGVRPSPRKLDVTVGERVYIRRAWPLLSALRRALRTERSVRVAVLYGSQARGSAGPRSDIDLAVLAEDGADLHALRTRLERAVGRDVQIVDLDAAMASARMRPELLTDGRTLVCRGDVEWQRLGPRKGGRVA